MLIKTILNKCHKFKSFVYVESCFSDFQDEDVIEVTIKPRKNSSAICSICNRPAPCYDTGKKARRFEFIPFWGFLVFFIYHMRRVECPDCGIHVEAVPWATGKQHQTKIYMQFLAYWSKKLSWKDVVLSF